MNKRIIICFFTLIAIIASSPVSAQTPTPSPGPVYIVQSGDTLWDIAIRFNVTVDDLMAANSMVSQEIFVGNRLIIPGFPGLSGTLITQPVPFGESLRSLSRQYRIDPALLIKLNHIVSPTELYAGYSLVILQQEAQPALTARAALPTGDTLLELAVR
jgi:LysM repeat protein